jgi:hypothetical protein
MPDLITHLLGYLTPEHWKDVLKNYPQYDKDEVYRLMKEQEEAYAFNLISDVEELLEV